MGNFLSFGPERDREDSKGCLKESYHMHVVVPKGELIDKRVIVVGDVHGCLDELITLLEECCFDPTHDRVVLVGDLVNKGPKSAEVVRYVRGIPQVLCVKGNHDDALLKVLQSAPELRPAKYSYASQLSKEDVSWLAALPLTITLEDLDAIIVHAGLLPNKSLQAQSTTNMTTMRNIKMQPCERGESFVASECVTNGGVAWSSLWPGPLHVYFGHDAVRGIQRHAFATGLDSGCCYGRELSAMVLPEKTLVQVQAKQVYQVPGGPP